MSAEGLLEDLLEDAAEAYDRREASLGTAADGTPILREIERRVVLSVLDRKWREHLYEMDYLQEGIGLRAMGQRDPLVEYQREGFDMFSAMMDAIKEESVGFLFNVEVQVNEEPSGETDVEPEVAAVFAGPVPQLPAADEESSDKPARPSLGKSLDAPRPQQGLTYTAPSVDGEGGPVVTSGHGTDLGDGLVDATGGKPGRNDPCPCGSGRKYKRCHGDPSNRQAV